MDEFEHSFEYNAELAKVNFQSSVSSLLEIHSQFGQKLAYAYTNKKNYISFSIEEVEILQSFLLKTCSGLGADYDSIARVNFLLNKNYKLLDRLFQEEVHTNYKDKVV